MMQLKKYTLSWKKWIFFKKKSLLIGILLLILLVVSISFIKVKNVYCYCDGQVCEESVCNATKNQIGNNLLTLNKRRLERNLNSGGKYQKIAIEVKPLNTVTVNFHSVSDFFVFNSTITTQKIPLSINNPPPSSDSAAFFNKPSVEIAEWLKDLQLISIKIFPSGQQETVSTTSSQIFAITADKKDSDWYKLAHQLIKKVLAYANVSGVYFIDNNVYFAQVGQPDIIVSMDYDEEKLTKSLQSLGFLTTIKKDPKIIDLRYTNPIIR